MNDGLMIAQQKINQRVYIQDYTISQRERKKGFD